ncbi:hypothetical protein [Hydrogenophaga soli]
MCQKLTLGFLALLGFLLNQSQPMAQLGSQPIPEVTFLAKRLEKELLFAFQLLLEGFDPRPLRHFFGRVAGYERKEAALNVSHRSLAMYFCGQFPLFFGAG